MKPSPCSKSSGALSAFDQLDIISRSPAKQLFFWGCFVFFVLNARADFIEVHAKGIGFAGPQSGQVMDFNAVIDTDVAYSFTPSVESFILTSASLKLGSTTIADATQSALPIKPELRLTRNVPGPSDEYDFNFRYLSSLSDIPHEQIFDLILDFPTGTITDALLPLPGLDQSVSASFEFIDYAYGTSIGNINSLTFQNLSNPSDPQNPGAVPEPSTYGMAGAAGLLTLVLLRRKTKRAA